MVDRFIRIGDLGAAIPGRRFFVADGECRRKRREEDRSSQERQVIGAILVMRVPLLFVDSKRNTGHIAEQRDLCNDS